MTTIPSPGDIRALPMPIRRFVMRVLRETDWTPIRISVTDYEHASYCYICIEDEPQETFSFAEDGSYRLGDSEQWHVTFRKRPGEGWRFRDAENGDFIIIRTITDLLWRIGSDVEQQKLRPA
jgi:hypothetical protein